MFNRPISATTTRITTRLTSFILLLHLLLLPLAQLLLVFLQYPYFFFCFSLFYHVMVQKPIFVLLVMCTVQKEKSFKWGFLSFSCLWSTLVLLVFSAVDGCVQHIKVVKCSLSLSHCFYFFK